MTPNGSRGGRNQQQQQQQQQQGGGNPYWELNRLSTTGRHFLLEPESRTGIVLDLHHRLQREQRKRREQQLRSNNNTQQQQQQQQKQQSADEDNQQSETPATAADEQLEVHESTIQAEASTPALATSMATGEADSMSPGELGQDAGHGGSRLKTRVAPDQALEKSEGAKDAETQLVGSGRSKNTAPAAADGFESDKQSAAWRSNQKSVTKAPPTAAPADVDDSASDTSEGQGATRRNNQKRVARAPVKDVDPVPDRQETVRRNNPRWAARAQIDDEDSVPDRLETARRNNPRTARSQEAAQLDYEDPIRDRQGTARRNNLRSTGRAPVAARTQVQVAAEDPAVAWSNHTKTEPAPAASFEGGSVADRQAAMHRYSQRSTEATTAATDTGGQMSALMAGLPTQPTPPCLQCLMRSLHECGLLGSCWTTAVLELEEAFTIRDVADACGSRLREGEVSTRQQTTAPRRAISKLQAQGTVSQGVISSGEGSAATPQVDVSKWQALERLCHLRNSLRECPHLIES